MSNIQLFESAFAVNFPVEVAELVLNRIGDVYGAEFTKKYAGYSDEELVQLACTVLSGLTPADITRGILRMNSEEWCPNLPKFRSWCEQGGDWWTADMAWAKALQFENDKKSEITTLAKRSLDEVRHILNVEGQKAAHYAFNAIYQDYLARAKEKGRVQEMWKNEGKTEKAKALTYDERNRKGVPCPPELAAKVKGAFKRPGRVA